MLKNIGLKPTLHHSEPIKGENRILLDNGLGIYEFNKMTVLRTAEMPAILVECGIIINRKEELLVSSDEFKKKFARAIEQAIIEFITPSNDKNNLGNSLKE